MSSWLHEEQSCASILPIRASVKWHDAASETACWNQREDLLWTPLVLFCPYRKPIQPATARKLKQPKSIFLPGGDVGCPNVWSEPVWGWDGVKDRLPGQMEWSTGGSTWVTLGLGSPAWASWQNLLQPLLLSLQSWSDWDMIWLLDLVFYCQVSFFFPQEFPMYFCTKV